MSHRSGRRLEEKGFFDRVFDRFVHNATSRSLTASWLFTLTLLMVALLGTWNFTPMLIGDFMLGVLMTFGGLLMFFETVYEEDAGGFQGDASDIAGLVSSFLALFYGVGLVVSNEFFTTHFSGVQGSALLILIVFLVFEGVGNRV